LFHESVKCFIYLKKFLSPSNIVAIRIARLEIRITLNKKLISLENGVPFASHFGMHCTISFLNSQSVFAWKKIPYPPVNSIF